MGGAAGRVRHRRTAAAEHDDLLGRGDILGEIEVVYAAFCRGPGNADVEMVGQARNHRLEVPQSRRQGSLVGDVQNPRGKRTRVVDDEVGAPYLEAGFMQQQCYQVADFAKAEHKDESDVFFHRLVSGLFQLTIGAADIKGQMLCPGPGADRGRS